MSGRLRRALGVAAVVLLLGASAAHADDHDPERAAHPLRVVAYVVHPIGVILDRVVVRPFHWLVHRKSLATLFGHKRS